MTQAGRSKTVRSRPARPERARPEKGRPQPGHPQPGRPKARPAPGGPVVVNGVRVSGLPRERVFGGPTPDGPLPGHLLVLLSRLHRAEAARARPGPGQG